MENHARPRFGAIALAAVALLFGLALSSSITLGGCGSKPKAGTCSSDKDCKAPLVCSSNKCVECG